MEDLLADFIAESREMLDALGGEIVAWESSPADRSHLDVIFRFVHTVKGNCGFFDFPRLEALSHAAEDALADVRAGRRQADAALVTAVLGVIDRIGEMIDAIEAGEDFPEGGDDALIAAMEPDAYVADSGSLPLAVTSAERNSAATSALRSIRLPVDLLDTVMTSVSDLVLARNDLARCLREGPGDAASDAAFQLLSSILTDVRDAMTRIRMQRIENLFALLPRLVRDLAAELGKQAMVDIDGGDVELDREMIEMIRDPLTHIIRNAVDHGIETPAERRALGKREIGLLAVTARQSGNQILIDIVDDGRGIDEAKLVAKAIAAGVITQAEAAKLSLRERYALVCAPGLSTSDSVTAISGRGVGMDIVKSNVERLGGGIEIDSTPGAGTRMTLRAPLTLTITPALTVVASGQKFAIPRSYVEEIVRSEADSIEIAGIGAAHFARIRNRRLPLIALADVLGVASSLPLHQQTLIVLRSAGHDRFAVAVDKLHDHEDLVVKPIAPEVMALGLYAGTTLSDDGSPVLVLDVPGLASAGGLDLDSPERRPQELETTATRDERPTNRALLVLGFDGRRKAIRMPVIERIEEAVPEQVSLSEGRTRIVLGGQILPVFGIDADNPPQGPFNLCRLGDGAAEICFAFARTYDIAALDRQIVPAEVPGPVEGVTLIDGEVVEIVDAHWLFAHHAAHAPALPAGTAAGRTDGAERLVCRMPLEQAWMSHFLRPIVESAGYHVIGSTDDSVADVAILGPTCPAEPAIGGRLIRLRDDIHAAPGAPDSIYRYDRDAIVAALRPIAVGDRR